MFIIFLRCGFVDKHDGIYEISLLKGKEHHTDSVGAYLFVCAGS